ncbi:hypothetical protein TWF730_002397 [Orbilia blumenaviensis]|uniref:Uncharacterized protein n=1 Tax=Orbilia blumenaviensis TaxID=1796055 RepID=A0AAV9UEA9_9PEZI
MWSNYRVELKSRCRVRIVIVGNNLTECLERQKGVCNNERKKEKKGDRRYNIGRASHNRASWLHPLHSAQVLFNSKFLKTLGALNEVLLDSLDQLLAPAVAPVVLVSVWGAAGCEKEVSAAAELVIDLSEVAHFDFFLEVGR